MSSLTTFDAFLKENYGNNDRVQSLLYKDFPFLGFVTKKTGSAAASGDTLIAPVIYGTPQGLSATLANAQTAAAATGGSTQAKKWTCSYGDYSAAVTLSDKEMKLSASDNGAYFEAKKIEIDNLYIAWSQVFSTYLAGSKARCLGSCTTSSGVCTMTYPEDIVNISPGMLLVGSADNGSSSAHTLVGSGAIGYVIAVNPNAGTFTVSATDSTTAGDPSGWDGYSATALYVFRSGDFGGASAATVIDGFSDWCPVSDPSATLYNGVDRTANITALSGIRLTSAEVAGLSTEQRIKRLVTRMSGRGFGAPEAIFLNPEKWQDVADGLESRGVRDAVGKDAAFGYQKIQVAAGGRLVDIYSDRFIPVGGIYALRKDALAIHTPEEFPAIVNGDGLQMLRKATTNDYEFRLTAYPCTVATPGYLGRATTA